MKTLGYVLIHHCSYSDFFFSPRPLKYISQLTDAENRLVAARGRGSEGRMDREFGINRCKLLYIGWINSKVPLYSTGNYIWYPVIICKGKEYEKEYIYMYDWVALLCSKNQHNIVNPLNFNVIKKILVSSSQDNLTHTL